MKKIKIYRALFASLLSGFLIGLIVTDALQSRIFFSLFIGIPTGLLFAGIVFGFLVRIEHRCAQEKNRTKQG